MNYYYVFSHKNGTYDLIPVVKGCTIPSDQLICEADEVDKEIERLTEELEMSEKILKNMTGGQDPDEILNI